MLSTTSLDERDTGRQKRARLRNRRIGIATVILTLGVPLAVGAWLSDRSNLLFFSPYRGGVFLSDRGVTYQQSSVDCGVAALQMLLSSRGVSVPADSLLRHLTITSIGISAHSMMQAAAAFGVELQLVRASPGVVSESVLPVVGLVDGNHYVLLERVNDRTAVVADPMIGRILLDRDRLAEIWLGPTLMPSRAP